MHVSILVFEDCTSIAMISPMEILYKAGQMCHEIRGIQDRSNFFEVELVSLDSKMVRTANNYPVYCHKTLKEVEHTDLVIIPAMDGDIEKKLDQNKAFVPWIQQMFHQGSEVASICTGAFMLAETGLLDGHAATTHWLAMEQFKLRYPQIDVQDDSILVDSGRIYSSGGATSFLNLMMYLVEKFCGRDVAVYASKVLLIDIHKEGQNSYAIFSTQKQHQDKVVLAAQNLIEERFDKKIVVEQLAHEVAVSPRNFIRRFKKATGNTPLEYIQRVKIEAVKKALESEQEHINSIIRDVGYDDISTFRKLFKRYTGVSPMAYRKKYQRKEILV